MSRNLVRRPPPTVDQVSRLFRLLDWNGVETLFKPGVDSRWRSISPVALGVLEAIYGDDGTMPTRATREHVRLVARSIGSTEPKNILTGAKEVLRSCIVGDWAIRCALPAWIDAALPRETALAIRLDPDRHIGRLRGLQPLFWSEAIHDANGRVLDLLIQMEREENVAKYLPLSQRKSFELARGAAEAAQQASAQLLDIRVRLAARSRVDLSWFAHRTADFAGITVGGYEISRNASIKSAHKELRARLPALLNLILSVTAEDTQQTTANRCAWTLPDRRELRRSA